MDERFSEENPPKVKNQKLDRFRKPSSNLKSYEQNFMNKRYTKPLKQDNSFETTNPMLNT